MKTIESFQDLGYLNRERIVRTEHQKLMLSDQYKALTPKQNELYRRLLFGLSIYTPEELYTMNSAKKKRIAQAHAKATKILNVYKQEVIAEKLHAAAVIVDNLLPKEGTIKSTVVTCLKKYEDRQIVRKNTRLEAPSELMPALFKKLLELDVEPDPNFSPSLTFKKLDITKQMIIKKLLDCKLLPSNFESL